MNPAIGIDVSKGESQGQAFLVKNKPYGNSFRFLHTNEGLALFLETVSRLEKESESDP